MKKVFKMEGGQLVDAIKHTIEMFSKYPDAKIFVGTDSQNKRHLTCFVVTIGYKMGNRGMHCIFHKENVKKIKDRYTRLWREVEISLEVAKYLELSGFKTTCVELDFNEKEMAKSHAMVAAARGYIVGSGFDCNVKPDLQSAVRYSDYQCRQ